jgi:phosphatidylinositol alpha-1,6-mannosyltransferase
VAGPELVLVGDGPERSSLERQVRRSRLRGVTFTGALGPAGVLGQLRRADVFALPVRTRLAGLDPEGLGLAALEASACGLPVVVGRSGGAPETVVPGRTGYVVDPDDPYELATRLADLLADPGHARELGAAGRSFVGDRYGADRARRALRTALGLSDVATV